MATADQVKAHIRSHADGHERCFYDIALQVAAPSADAKSAQGDGT